MRKKKMVGLRRNLAAILVLGVAISHSSTVSWAQSGDLQEMVDRLERLERDIRTLNTTVYKGQTPPTSASVGGSADPASAARLAVRITELEGEVRNATGTVESLAYDVRQLNDRLDRMMADIDYRLSSMGAGRQTAQQTAGQSSDQTAAGAIPQVGRAPTIRPVTQVGPRGGRSSGFGTVTEAELQAVADRAPPIVEEKISAPNSNSPSTEVQAANPQAQVENSESAVLPGGTVKEQYDFARKFLMKGKFDQAETALRAFLEAHPQDPLAGNARYWLGETHYVRADYLKAAEIFLEGYRQDPKGTKAPDGLLKLGMALSQLGKNPEACATFAKLVKEFPKASTNLLKVTEREKKRSGCE